MTTRDAFLERSASIDEEIEKLEAQIQETKVRDTPPLNCKLHCLIFLREAINCLKKTPQQEDPGKHETAWYFVAAISDEDIVRSNKPKMYKTCDECGTNQPALMTYSQTYDSYDGDTWAKEAFIICCAGKKNIAQVCRDHRF